MSLTRRTHELIIDHFSEVATTNKLAIDATCGNGHDTEFLASHFRQVTAFDIQQHAIQKTTQRLQNANLHNVTLVHDGHQHIKQHISTKVDCIMFNLGYLPSADKNITTTESTTLNALEVALNILNESGLISILCYPGHPQGQQETKAIQLWLQHLDMSWQVKEVLASHPGPRAPILYLISAIKVMKS